MQVSWADVQEKHKELAQLPHRLRWIVEFAFVSWAEVSRGKQMEWQAGLLAFVPETVAWQEDAEGLAWADGWVTSDVEAFQARLQPMVTASADGESSLVCIWYPPKSPEGVERAWTAIAGIPLHGPPGSAALYTQNESFHKVELAILYTLFLLRELPGRVMRCQAPRARWRAPDRATCDAIFFGRPDQKWCGAACAARWRRGGKTL